MLLYSVNLNVIIILINLSKSMAKKTQMLYKLVSTAGTGFFYVGEKNSKNAARKLQLRKFDPVVNRHVMFVE